MILNNDGIFDRDVDGCLNKIKEYCHKLENDKKILLKRLQNYNKETEIAIRNGKIEYLRTHALEILTDSEMIADKDFRHDHYERCGNGDTFEYTLTGTGLGSIIKIRCPKCGECKDITDNSKF